MIKQYKFITKSSFDWTDKIKHNIQTWLEQTQTNTDEMRLCLVEIISLTTFLYKKDNDLTSKNL